MTNKKRLSDSLYRIVGGLNKFIQEDSPTILIEKQYILSLKQMIRLVDHVDEEKLRKDGLNIEKLKSLAEELKGITD